MAGYGIQIKGSGRALMKKGGRSFPDLTGDGKVTRADVLKGRGVFAKGGRANTRRENRLEELGRVDAEKAYTRKGKKNLREEKDRIRTEVKDGGKVPKGYHRTKDGRVAKKGLYYYMNRAKKRGTSKPGKGSVSDKALKQSAKTAKK